VEEPKGRADPVHALQKAEGSEEEIESLSFTELEKCHDKARKIKELSPKQKSSLSKKAYQLGNMNDRRSSNRSKESRERDRDRDKDKENMRSLSPVVSN